MKYFAALCVTLAISSTLGFVINGVKQKRFYQWEPDLEILNMDRVALRQRSHIDFVTQLRERKSYADMQLTMDRMQVPSKASEEDSASDHGPVHN